MNNVVLIGRLTRDPELAYTPQNQTPVCRFTLAVDRPKYKGEDQGADFIRITAWGKLAELTDQYLSKGRMAGVQGRLTTGSYKNKDGVTIYTTEVTAEQVQFLGGNNNNQQQEPQQTPNANMSGFDDLPDTFQAAEDDIPF